jgi:DNA-binding NtrC family response regulator
MTMWEHAMQIGVEMAKAIENRRIFIVDGDEIFRAAIQFMLHDEYEAHEVESAGAALAKIDQTRPDLIVVAENVLHQNGLDVIKEFLSRAPKARILVVIESLASGFGKQAMEAGAHGFLAKPLRIELVRDKVDALLSGGKSVIIPLNVLTVR